MKNNRLRILFVCLAVFVPCLILVGCNNSPDLPQNAPELYSVSYNLDGGVLSSENPTEYSVLSDLSNLHNPSKYNNEFVGWYIDSEFKTELNQLTQNPKRNLVLYAKWKWYDISTPNDLQNMKLNCNYRLINSLDMSSVSNFVPVGNFDNPYTGIFDGQDYEIKNLAITKVNEDYAGIFGFMKNAEVKNLDITSCSLLCSRVNYAGILAGRVRNTKIENVTAKEITVNASFGTSVLSEYVYIGGFVGESEYDSQIYRCKITARDVNIVTSTKTSSGHLYIGGFIGNNQSLIKTCFAFVDVTADGGQNSKNSVDAGGFCGYNYGTIEQFYFIGSCTASNISGGYSDGTTAGLVANNQGVLNNFFTNRATTLNHAIDQQSGVVNNGYLYASSASIKVDYLTTFTDISLVDDEAYMKSTMKFTDSHWYFDEGCYPNFY